MVLGKHRIINVIIHKCLFASIGRLSAQTNTKKILKISEKKNKGRPREETSLKFSCADIQRRRRLLWPITGGAAGVVNHSFRTITSQINNSIYFYPSRMLYICGFTLTHIEYITTDFINRFVGHGQNGLYVQHHNNMWKGK